MSIASNAMVLNLQIGIWQGYRLDREASAKVVEDAGAHADAARVNKHLVPKEALKDINTASNAVRSHFKDKTLPWKDNGDRLLTRLMFADFIETHEKLTKDFKDAVEEFVTVSYPEARARAEFRMGELFDSNDYPSAESLRRRFYIGMDIDPVTSAGDFRVEMEADELDLIKATMEKALQERIGRAMLDVWTRLADVVGHFAAKMGSDGVFRDSTMKNIEEMVDLLPGLNVLNDPDLARLGDEIKATLTGYDLKDLRKRPDVRKQAAFEANEIMDRMKGFMGAFGSGDE